MDIWTVPLVFVIVIICLIGFASVRKWHRADPVVNGQDSAIPEAIEEHPFTLNPIIWVILVAKFLYNMKNSHGVSLEGFVLNGGLEEEIELMREAMMDAASREGLTADVTMEFSRKLDSLINQYEARKEELEY